MCWLAGGCAIGQRHAKENLFEACLWHICLHESPCRGGVFLCIVPPVSGLCRFGGVATGEHRQVHAHGAAHRDPGVHRVCPGAGLSRGSQEHVGCRGRPWPPRRWISQMFARRRALEAPFWAKLRFCSCSPRFWQRPMLEVLARPSGAGSSKSGPAAGTGAARAGSKSKSKPCAPMFGRASS